MLVTWNLLYAILRAWILGVYNPTRSPSSSLRGALMGLPACRQAWVWVRMPVGQDAPRGLSNSRRQPTWLLRREIPTRLGTRLEWLRDGTNFLGKSLDTWPVRMVKSGIFPKRTFRIFSKCRIYHLISGFFSLCPIKRSFIRQSRFYDHIVRFIIISPKYHLI